MFARLRTGLHKHGKEGLLCLLESCTAVEYEAVRGGCWPCCRLPPAAAQCSTPAMAQQCVRAPGRRVRLQLLCAAAAHRAPAGRPPSPAQVLLALGGRGAVERKLRGCLRVSWHYVRRMDDIEATHAALGPDALAYENGELKYAALPPPGRHAVAAAGRARREEGSVGGVGAAHTCREAA